MSTALAKRIRINKCRRKFEAHFEKAISLQPYTRVHKNNTEISLRRQRWVAKTEQKTCANYLACEIELLRESDHKYTQVLANLRLCLPGLYT